jgi:Matrixin
MAGALTAFAITVVAAPSAWGYCRSSTCSDGQCFCYPSIGQCDTCKPLGWQSPCVGITVQSSASREIDMRRVLDTLDRAFSAWTQASCADGGTPGIVVQNLGFVSCGDVEYNSKAGNANVLVFRDDAWTHPDNPEQIALTTTTFSTQTGEIFNADMEINTADYEFPDFTLVPPDAQPNDSRVADLASVLTHEAGHFLGIAHSDPTEDPTAPLELQPTMHSAYSPSTVAQAQYFQTLERDDIDAICAIYPPAALDVASCNPIPRHGFATECADQQVLGCGIAPAPRPAVWAGLLAGAAALGVTARRRRCRRG